MSSLHVPPALQPVGGACIGRQELLGDSPHSDGTSALCLPYFVSRLLTNWSSSHLADCSSLLRTSSSLLGGSSLKLAQLRTNSPDLAASFQNLRSKSGAVFHG